MSDMIKEIKIINGNSNIFDTEEEYTIPLYQRAYAWEDKQIIQLIEDINDIDDDNYKKEKSNYYIGSLIVYKTGNKYEVVDGQQRLTSLYLLLNSLGITTLKTLSFACRDKSNYTLKNIEKIIGDDKGSIDTERIEQNIQRGLRIIKEELSRRIEKEDFNKQSFIEKLSRVIIYRIEVPRNTDLNRYFEIMNIRGEQLEQHDILKAELMGHLRDENERTIFARIWDACSDMTGYVQMHFDKKSREHIFGNEWDNIPSLEWKDYLEIDKETQAEQKKEDVEVTLEDIIKPNFKVEPDKIYDDEGNRVRFESVIDFPYFLLHVLKIFVEENKLCNIDGKKELVDSLMDDKKLLGSYERVFSDGKYPNGSKVSEKKCDTSKKFILCLLRARFLFDKYIIKREYANDNIDGEWSLKEICVSGQQSKKKAYYSNSKFIKLREWDSTNNYRNKNNVMIQSALRVSYTSPKVMHWITKLLKWVYSNNAEHTKEDYITEYSDVAEQIAIEAVKKDFFEECRTEKGYNYAMGVYTPHIVFNYLDYLIWYENRTKYNDFVFEFRNSVEHWYPQNPSSEMFDSWYDGVDQFGNLCIIQRNVNSKFSNNAPDAKKSSFEKIIAKGSLKLRIMSELTVDYEGKPASIYWRETAYKQHEEEMIKILRKACGIVSNEV